MENIFSYFDTLYKNFNARKIELVIVNLASNVKWANGMEGGYVYGHEGVREYWAKQFSIVSSQVNPIEIKKDNGKVIVKAHQVVHDLSGNLVGEEVVQHIFLLENGKIAEFDIQKKK